MTNLSERDWQLLNGYHDGELPAPQRAALEERLRREPALAEALAGLRTLSAELKALPSAPPRPALPRVLHSPWRRIAAGGMLAASLALGLLLAFPRPDNPAMALHAAFVAQDFPVDETMLLRAATTPDLPNLAPARLALVASRRIEGGSAAHYAGLNGCRLTFFDTSAPVELSPEAGLRTATWQSETRHLAIVAQGMDPERFRAITTYLMQLTRHADPPDTRLALADATRRTNSCRQGKA